MVRRHGWDWWEGLLVEGFSREVVVVGRGELVFLSGGCLFIVSHSKCFRYGGIYI